jgi:hypothetical protein
MPEAVDLRIEPSWNGEEWRCAVPMPAWRDLLHDAAQDAVEATFLPSEGMSEEAPTSVQVATLQEVVQRQADLLTPVLTAMRQRYAAVRPRYLSVAPELASVMPPSPDASAFARLHRLTALHVHSIRKNGRAYVGFSFRASWDPEHGLGVLMHGKRVVDVGGADTAFIGWNAEQDSDAP